MNEHPSKPKHIWLSNSPHTNSGYAVESRDLLFRFLKRGYDFSCIGFYGVEGYPVYLYGQDLIDERFKDVPLLVYPKMMEPYGGDALVHHSQAHGAQAAFVMLDLFSLSPAYLEQLSKTTTKLIPYIPIDQEPVNPAILNNLRFAYKIITFSKYGQKALEKEGFASHLIPEGIDTEIFKPMDKAQMRQKYGLPQDVLLFGMVAANKENPPRKAFQQVLEAFKLFAEKTPNAALFFHTQQTSPSSFPIQDYARHLGIEKSVFIMNPYKAAFGADSKVIAELINMMDVYLNPSMTEGFGLGMIESQACGKVVVGNNCHSMPELVVKGKTGFICETDKPWWRSLNGYVYPPRVDSLYEQMEAAVKLAQKPATAKACRQHVVDNYNIDTLVEKLWVPFLTDLEEELAFVENP